VPVRAPSAEKGAFKFKVLDGFSFAGISEIEGKSTQLGKDYSFKSDVHGLVEMTSKAG